MEFGIGVLLGLLAVAVTVTPGISNGSVAAFTWVVTLLYAGWLFTRHRIEILEFIRGNQGWTTFSCALLAAVVAAGIWVNYVLPAAKNGIGSVDAPSHENGDGSDQSRKGAVPIVNPESGKESRLSAAPNQPVEAEAKQVDEPKTKSPSQKTSGNNSPIVTQGAGSIAQIGNNNQASIVNNPPSGWGMLSNDALTALTNTLKIYHGQRLHIKIANIDTNRQQMAMQIANAAKAAGWTATIENYMAWGDPAKEPPTGMQLHVREVTPTVQHFGSALVQLYGADNMHTGHRDENFEAALIELNIWPRKP